MELLKTAGIALAVLSSWLFTAFCTYKFKQLSGKDFVNELRTELGGGSFQESLILPVKKFIWGLLDLISLFVSIGLSLYLVTNLSAYDTSPSLKKQETVKIEQSVPKVNAAPQVVHEEQSRELTDEEVRQLEIEKNYFGDDPIVRKRLGLPPKKTE